MVDPAGSAAEPRSAEGSSASAGGRRPGAAPADRPSSRSSVPWSNRRPVADDLDRRGGPRRGSEPRPGRRRRGRPAATGRRNRTCPVLPRVVRSGSRRAGGWSTALRAWASCTTTPVACLGWMNASIHSGSLGRCRWARIRPPCSGRWRCARSGTLKVRWWGPGPLGARNRGGSR